MRYKFAIGSCRQQWKRVLGHCAFALWLLLGATAASAEAAPRQLSVLRAGAADDPHALVVDAALSDALATRLPDTHVQTSAVPLEEVQLIAGCGDDQTTCLQLIANQLGSEALLVRRLVTEPSGSTLLSLVSFSTHANQGTTTRQASTSIDWSAPQAAEGAVSLLLARLELTPAEPQPSVLAAPSEPELAPAPPPVERAPRARSRRRLRLGWTLSALGCGLLGAGLISGALSRRDERRYARVTIDGPEAVDDAHAFLSSAQRHARVANGLFIGGAVTTVAGVAATLWHWAGRRNDQGSAALSVQSTRSGLMLVLNGSWQGGS